MVSHHENYSSKGGEGKETETSSTRYLADKQWSSHTLEHWVTMERRGTGTEGECYPAIPVEKVDKRNV